MHWALILPSTMSYGGGPNWSVRYDEWFRPGKPRVASELI